MLSFRHERWPRWSNAVGAYERSEGRHPATIVLVVGVAYFLAAWLGLTLRSQAGVAVFCPAAGIAVGALIAARAHARLPIAVAVAVASAAAGLLAGRSPTLAVAF